MAAAALALVCFSAKAAAPASDTPADYGYSLPVSVTGGGVAALRLPPAVYLHAASSDLSDLRLFDRLGNKLPFALRQPAAQARTNRQQWPVAVFPVTGTVKPATAADSGGLDIRTGSDGRLLSVNSRPASGAEGSDKTALSSLILEVRAEEAAPLIGALHFSLPPDTRSYNAQVWLDVSDDLKQWEAIGPAALNWLVNSDTQTLSNDSITFAPRSFRYARLSWKEGAPLLFAGIRAESVSRDDVAAPTEQLLLPALPGQLGQDLVYNGAVAIPVEKIGLQFTEQNVVLPSLLGRYREAPVRQVGDSAGPRFEPLLRTTFYQITQAGQRRDSGDLPVSTLHVAQWVLRPEAGAAGKPALRLTWTPASVIFLANGNAPYTLAFGRAAASPGALALEQVAPGFKPAELLTLEQAKVGALTEHRPVPAEQADGLSPTLRLAALWGVLLLGLAVLGFFVWRLVRQMRDGDQAP